MPGQRPEVNESDDREVRVGSRVGAPATAHPWLEILVCAALAVAPFLWRLASGTRGLANDDTWAYQRIFANLVETGSLDLIDWNDISLVGMFPITRAWVAIVGDRPELLHLLGSVMAFVGLLALRSVMRTLAPAATLAAVVAYGLFAGFVFTSGTYMGDQFAVAGVLVTFALVIHLVVRETPPAIAALLLCCAVIASAFAFSVRQQTVVGIALCVLILFLGPDRRRWDWLVLGLGFAAFAGPFYLWRWSLDDPGSTELTFNADQLGSGLVLTVVALSLSIAPYLVHRDGIRVLTRWPIARVVGSVVAAAAVAATEPSGVLYDFMRRAGDGGLVVRVVAGLLCWNAVVTVAAGLWGRRPRPGDRLALVLAVVAVLSLIADLAIIVLSSAYYPRYSMVTLAIWLVALAISVLGGRVENERLVPTDAATEPGRGIAWALFAVVGIWVYWALDTEQVHLRIVLDVAEVTSCAGIPDAELDGGIVWVGQHTSEPAHAKFWEITAVDDGLPATQQQQLFAGQERRAVVTTAVPEPRDGTTIVGPFVGGGMLPGSEAERWLVVRDVDAEEVAKCAVDHGVPVPS